MGEVAIGVRCRLCDNQTWVYAFDYDQAKEIATQDGSGWRQHFHYVEESANAHAVMFCPNHTDEQAFAWYDRNVLPLRFTG